MIDMCLWCNTLCLDCVECNECLCDECTNSSPHQGKCHNVSLVLLKFLSLVAFLVDACVGVFMNSCLSLLVLC
jgi:hypothetical protein